MSEEKTLGSVDDLIAEETPVAKAPVAEAIPAEQTPVKAKKVFTKADLVRSVPVEVVLPGLYPDFEPWGFNLRLKFSQEAEERRQEYLSLTPSEQTVKLDDQSLDELCDLLISTPTGFGDIQDTGKGPGVDFKTYVNGSDPVMKDMLYTVIRGAISLYWRKISPQEFRK